MKIPKGIKKPELKKRPQAEDEEVEDFLSVEAEDFEDELEDEVAEEAVEAEESSVETEIELIADEDLLAEARRRGLIPSDEAEDDEVDIEL